MPEAAGAGKSGDHVGQLMAQLRMFSNRLAASAPEFGVAAGTIRLREAGQALGLLSPGGVSEAELQIIGHKLGDECSPFDVEVGAARLRHVAGALGLIAAGNRDPDSEEFASPPKRARVSGGSAQPPRR